tara:strand:- start:1023 stop:1235 length:213 start_codon:yes stop_codon:yes gene_type:complete
MLKNTGTGYGVTGKEYATQNNAKQQQRPTKDRTRTAPGPTKNAKKTKKTNQNNTPTPKNKINFYNAHTSV